MTKRAPVIWSIVLCLALSALFAQPPSKKKAHTLHGKIEQVNASTKSLTVNHEKVEGWMDAMTMTYAVDKESVLKELKPGDQIKATVYDGDFTLYEIQKEPPKK
jgi:Cu/Ag efflux protein CusF